jgi:hypothetical protein
MAVADRNGLPVAVSVESATPHEVKLVESTLVQMVIPVKCPRSLYQSQCEFSVRVSAGMRSGAGDGV